MSVRTERHNVLVSKMAATLAVAALALPVSVAHAQGDVGTGTEVQPREIAVSMTDALQFDPSEITVAAGEVVRFILTNPTAATHDFLIGDLATQEEHGAQMAAGVMHMDEACPEPMDHQVDEAMPHDDGMMMEDEMASPAAEDGDTDMPMADASMGHMDGGAEHMDEAMDHMQGALCASGIPGAVTIEPGETVSVLARFDEPGETLIGCHQPGHWAAGMKGVITIVDDEAGSPTSSPQP